MMSKVVLWGLCLISLSARCNTDHLSWCDPELCPNGAKHTACENTGGFHENCESDAEILDLRSYRDFILHEHNKRRNFVAYGLLPGYYPAARMATLQWDDELAFLAELNVRTCVVDHDACKNTYRFRNVGQNLVGIARERHLSPNLTEVIQRDMGLWFEEHSLINSDYITKFKTDKNFEKYGHFAEFVVERSTHVGCAMLRYTHRDLKFLHIYNFACNYGSVYALTLPVYQSGEPGSLCETGTNPKYPALCSVREPYNPNYN